MARKSESPRAHGRTQGNTSTVTFRFPSGAPRVMLVHGRRTEVDSRIRTAVEQGHDKITFRDLHSNRNVTINLKEVDTWRVTENR